MMRPLDQFQQQVVSATADAIRMVAPAGSGKTETLAYRVLAQVQAGVAPQRILLLTFDTNSRDSLKARLQSLGAPSAVNVSTLNAFGYRLLRQRFRDERSRLVRDIFFPQSPALKSLVEEYGHSVFTEMLGKIKNEAFDTRTIERSDLGRWCSKHRDFLLRDLEDDPILADLDDRRFGREIAGEMIAYERFLEGRNGIDFDDQKLRPYLRLSADAAALAWLQQQFDEVIVDEFQDINRLDALLINQIAGQSRLVITGDDDQAIYGFRGATASFLISPDAVFHRQFQTFELAMNYRCPPRILQRAGTLIGHNEHRIEKHPRAAKSMAGEVQIVAESDMDAEARAIARRLKCMLEQKERTAAILVRRRAQMPAIQAALIRAGTPYRVDAREDLRVIWSLARRALLVAPLAIGNVPDEANRREIIAVFCRSRSMPAQREATLLRLAVLDDRAFPGAELQQQLYERERADLARGLQALVGEMNVADRISKLDPLLNTEVRAYMEGGNALKRSRSDRETSRLGSLEDLARFRQENARTFAAHIDALLDVQRQHWRRGGAAAELLTCHGARGREWQVVCIPHCNQGVFPDSRSQEAEHLEAERKLFYVSMTRASEHLLMSWSQDRASGGSGDPSDFLVEAELEKRRAPANGHRTVTYRASEQRPPAASPARKLRPDGRWAMTGGKPTRR